MAQIRRGVHPGLEAVANKMLSDSLRSVTSHKEKSDVLTSWKEQDRRSREIHVPSGTPDGRMRRGMYHRRANLQRPHLNARDGLAMARRTMGSLSTFIAEHGYQTDDE